MSRKWGRGGNQTQAHSEMTGVLRWTPDRAYGDYAFFSQNRSALDKVFIGARTSARNRKRPITLASVPLRDLEDK